jgi:hypothetical protein
MTTRATSTVGGLLHKGLFAACEQIKRQHPAPTPRRSSVLDVDSYVHANSINMLIVIAIGTALRGTASSGVVTLHWPGAAWPLDTDKVEVAAIS